MSFDTIKTSEITKYIGRRNVLIIDLREREEFLAGHIPTAVNIPYEELEDEKYRFKRNCLLIFYCDRGNISLLAARDLIKDGYNIKSLYGGIRAYRGKLEC
ncbi:rhodanese-like domain-containing protein [Mobilitalea sibirica]|uniref:Rhodanese-like domain-containing protein n=1 Tax=Mobilitalea sibirica TaxID=1462919 RepID=A0A8J7H1U2_9FIRM|nr:rhodanese-like domain-containing protein [Mobilitalea sibirica]MBH1940498.1 rhodanese-like domain-containing protein [Mobilitalea sibirica]